MGDPDSRFRLQLWWSKGFGNVAMATWLVTGPNYEPPASHTGPQST